MCLIYTSVFCVPTRCFKNMEGGEGECRAAGVQRTVFSVMCIFVHDLAAAAGYRDSVKPAVKAASV